MNWQCIHCCFDLTFVLLDHGAGARRRLYYLFVHARVPLSRREQGWFKQSLKLRTLFFAPVKRACLKPLVSSSDAKTAVVLVAASKTIAGLRQPHVASFWWCHFVDLRLSSRLSDILKSTYTTGSTLLPQTCDFQERLYEEQTPRGSHMARCSSVHSHLFTLIAHIPWLKKNFEKGVAAALEDFRKYFF